MPPASTAAAATFTELYDVWYAHVARWVRSFGVRGPDQAEVTESVFFTVHRMLWHLSGPDPAAWLYRVTARQVREYRRRTWLRKILHRGGASSDAAIDFFDKQEVLRPLLTRVREPIRVAFILSEVEGYTEVEIARIQRIPIATVRLRIDRARGKLIRLVARSLRRH